MPPFQGSLFNYPFFPGLTPWATLLQPFGLQGYSLLCLSFVPGPVSACVPDLMNVFFFSVWDAGDFFYGEDFFFFEGGGGGA